MKLDISEKGEMVSNCIEKKVLTEKSDKRWTYKTSYHHHYHITISIHIIADNVYHLQSTGPYEAGTSIIPILYMRKLGQKRLGILLKVLCRQSDRVKSLNPGGPGSGRMIG